MMNRPCPTPKLIELVRELLSYEASRGQAARNGDAAGFAVTEKLRKPLMKLVGSASFLSLIERALNLAKARTPMLYVVHINLDGSLDGLSDLGSESREASVMLIAELLGLLVLFVGERITLSLVHGVWPDLWVEDK